MKKVQVAVAVATLLGATASMAASISQSGLTIAREVIAANTTLAQTIKAPSVSFNFDNGPTANANGSQDFNVTLKLGGDGTPTWGANVPTYKTIAAVRRNNGNQVVPVTAAGHVDANPVVFLRLMGVDDVDTTTKRFRFRLENQSAGSISLGDLQLSFNSVNPGNGAAAPYIVTTNAGTFDVVGGANTLLNTAPLTAEFNNIATLAASANAVVTGVGAAAGETGYYDAANVAGSCGEALRRVTVLARNFIGSGAGVEGESSGANLASITNNGYIVFGTALGLTVDIGAAKARATDPTSNNNNLTIPAGSGVTANVMGLGRVKFTNIANFDAWDTDTTGQYYKLRTTTAAPLPNEFTAATNTAGAVDMALAGAALSVAITSTNGFATGTTFGLSNTPNCSVTGGGIVTTAFAAPALSVANTVATITFTATQLATLHGGTNVTDSLTTPTIGGYAALFGAAPVSGNNGVYVCMTTTGLTQIPQSGFTGVAKLLKDHNTEQNNFSCPGTLAGLGGGVKIDVRNFFPYSSDTQEWISVIRVINNSETTTADLTGQYIRADGKYGMYGAMGDLAPRGARYYTSKEISQKLITATATAGADNSGAGGTTAVPGEALAANTRVRISSNAASTLRVQNYMFNTKTLQLVEVSASQGADFVNLEASSRDHIDQDAQTGIKK